MAAPVPKKLCHNDVVTTTYGNGRIQDLVVLAFYPTLLTHHERCSDCRQAEK
jgi:hypothetical protein